jgi:hypothetical protein
MDAPPETQPRHRRSSVPRDARLDAERHAKQEELAHTFHRKRAQILRHVMQWTLARRLGWTVDLCRPGRPHPAPIVVDPEWRRQGQAAAEAYGGSGAAWLRHAVRQVCPEGCPTSYRAGGPPGGRLPHAMMAGASWYGSMARPPRRRRRRCRRSTAPRPS